MGASTPKSIGDAHILTTRTSSQLGDTLLLGYTHRRMYFLKKIASIIIRFWTAHKYFRYIIGVLAIFYGIIALVTPLLPGSWFILVGLELLGLRILFWRQFKSWFWRGIIFLWTKRPGINFHTIKKVSMFVFRFFFRKRVPVLVTVAQTTGK